MRESVTDCDPCLGPSKKAGPVRVTTLAGLLDAASEIDLTGLTVVETIGFSMNWISQSNDRPPELPRSTLGLLRDLVGSWLGLEAQSSCADSARYRV